MSQDPTLLSIVQGLITSSGAKLDEVQAEQATDRAERVALRRDVDANAKLLADHIAGRRSPFVTFFDALAKNPGSMIAACALLVIVVLVGARSCGIDISGITTPLITTEASAPEVAP